MIDRDAIFREQLVSLVGDLYGGAGRERELRRLIGLHADKLAHDGGARDWADLKKRADGATYDSLLRLFEHQAHEHQKRGDARGVRVFEVLAVSLIARRQTAPDLQQGIETLDRYIEECARNASKAGLQFIPTGRVR